MTPNRKHVLALTLAALLAVSCGAKTFTDYRTSGIRRMPLGGGPIEVLYEGKGFWNGIAVDRTHVYATIEGEIVRVPKSGGDLELIAEGQPGPTHIVVDEGCVYWTNLGGGWAPVGNVMRAPKD